MTRIRTVDPKVHQLASDWLSEYEPGALALKCKWEAHDARVAALARSIQQSIEDWMENEAIDAEAEIEAHRTDEGDLGRLTIGGGLTR